jgi:CheY-like chemotaxis protein
VDHVGKAAAPFADYKPAADGIIAPGRGVDQERYRIEVERDACRQNLEKLNHDLEDLEAERERTRNMSEPAHRARLRRLAGMSPELRTPLHALLGCIQTLRLEGNLTRSQARRLDGMLEAGTELLEKIYTALNISDIESEPSNWRIEDAGASRDLNGHFDAASNALTVALHTHGGTEPPRHLRVLIADDVVMNREIAAAFMRAADHTVTMVENGDDAVSAAAAEDFDVILMDVRMPGTDGLEAARQIRALAGARRHTPIVALTALAFSDEVEACRLAGMNAHLAKPFRFDTLNEAILRAVGQTPALPDADVMRLPLPPPSLIRRRPAQAVSAERYPRAVAMDGDAAERAGGSSMPDEPLNGTRACSWIDIASPWNRQSVGVGSGGSPATSPLTADNAFELKLTSVSAKHGHRLVDSRLSCEPPQDREQHEFHWLLYVTPVSETLHPFSANCDLWRWSRGTWRSVTVPGAQFSPEEMHDQGWRYCGPCLERTARVQVRIAGAGRAPQQDREGKETIF